MSVNANLIRNQVYIQQVIQQQMEAKRHGVDVTVSIYTDTSKVIVFMYLDGQTGKSPDYKAEIKINEVPKLCSAVIRRVVTEMQQLILKHVNKRVH